MKRILTLYTALLLAPLPVFPHRLLQPVSQLRVARFQEVSLVRDPPDLVTNGPDPSVAEKWKGSGHVARPHLENWLDAIRLGTKLNAPVEVGHRTVTICHLANIARELNRPLRWNPEPEQFIDDNDEANRSLDRPRRKGFELPQV